MSDDDKVVPGSTYGELRAENEQLRTALAEAIELGQATLRVADERDAAQAALVEAVNLLDSAKCGLRDAGQRRAWIDRRKAVRDVAQKDVSV